MGDDMNRMVGKVATVVSVVFLLGGVAPAAAFSFCFSPGGGASQHSRYADYPPPYPLVPQAGYGAYPYSPQPYAPYYGAYYPPVSPQPYAGGVMTLPQGYR